MAATEQLAVLVEYEAPPPEPTDRPSLAVVRLQSRAAASLASLDTLVAAEGGAGISIRERFWIVPAALTEATASGIQRMAALPGVRRLYLDERLPVRLEPSAAGVAPPSFTSEAMRTIGADAVWDDGLTGEGVTVAFFDTGVDGGNAMLASRWRGRRTPLRASWFDPFLWSSVPQDRNGHGTQVAVAAVGALPAGDTLRFPDGTTLVAGSDIDVVAGPAPRAEWIAARVFETFGGAVYTRRSVLLQAFQWALDPDANPATDDAPGVINNSWGVFPGTSGFDPCGDIVYGAIDAAEAAGIAVLFAAGNTGPAPGTVTPPGARDAPALRSFAVGSSQGSGAALSVADYSGRGPSPCGGGLKPEIIAPGTVPEIRTAGPSAARLTGFTVQGTSFSVAQASGALALMKQLRPSATPEQAKRFLIDGASDVPPSGPDNDAGFGLLDVPAAASRADPSFAGTLLQLRAARRWGDSLVIELRNRGSRSWPGGRLSLEERGVEVLSRAVPGLPAGGSQEVRLRLSATGRDRETVRAIVFDSRGGVAASRLLYAGPPDLFGGYILTAGALQAGGNDFGRLGRIAAFKGFEWRGQELLPAASFVAAGSGRLSDGLYTSVLGEAGLKASPPAAETDWAPARSATDVEEARAVFRFDDFRALAPVGLEVDARVEASEEGGVAALTLTTSIRNRSGARIPDLVPGLFVDWDLEGGESVRWSAGLEALISEPLAGGSPVVLIASERSPVARAAVPLGTPGPGGVYEAGSGILVDEFQETVKRDLVTGGPPGGLPGFGTATDQAQLLSVGPIDVASGEAIPVRFWLLAAESEQAAGARLQQLRAEVVEPPGQGDSFTAEPPFPNPLTVGEGVVTFPYTLPEAAGVSGRDLAFEIYDVAGRRLVRRTFSLGGPGALPLITWDGRLGDGREAASGAYLFVFRLGDEVRSGRVIIIR